jgi:hypothetical protein
VRVVVPPRVREDSVHPRLCSGASVRLLNFTVRRRGRVVGPRTKEAHDECEFTH